MANMKMKHDVEKEEGELLSDEDDNDDGDSGSQKDNQNSSSRKDNQNSSSRKDNQNSSSHKDNQNSSSYKDNQNSTSYKDSKNSSSYTKTVNMKREVPYADRPSLHKWNMLNSSETASILVPIHVNSSNSALESDNCHRKLSRGSKRSFAMSNDHKQIYKRSKTVCESDQTENARKEMENFDLRRVLISKKQHKGYNSVDSKSKDNKPRKIIVQQRTNSRGYLSKPGRTASYQHGNWYLRYRDNEFSCHAGRNKYVSSKIYTKVITTNQHKKVTNSRGHESKCDSAAGHQRGEYYHGDKEGGTNGKTRRHSLRESFNKQPDLVRSHSDLPLQDTNHGHGPHRELCERPSILHGNQTRHFMVTTPPNMTADSEADIDKKIQDIRYNTDLDQRAQTFNQRVILLSYDPANRGQVRNENIDVSASMESFNIGWSDFKDQPFGVNNALSSESQNLNFLRRLSVHERLGPRKEHSQFSSSTISGNAASSNRTNTPCESVAIMSSFGETSRDLQDPSIQEMQPKISYSREKQEWLEKLKMLQVSNKMRRIDIENKETLIRQEILNPYKIDRTAKGKCIVGNSLIQCANGQTTQVDMHSVTDDKVRRHPTTQPYLNETDIKPVLKTLDRKSARSQASTEILGPFCNDRKETSTEGSQVFHTDQSTGTQDMGQCNNSKNVEQCNNSSEVGHTTGTQDMGQCNNISEMDQSTGIQDMGQCNNSSEADQSTGTQDMGQCNNSKNMEHCNNSSGVDQTTGTHDMGQCNNSSEMDQSTGIQDMGQCNNSSEADQSTGTQDMGQCNNSKNMEQCNNSSGVDQTTGTHDMGQCNNSSEADQSTGTQDMGQCNNSKNMEQCNNIKDIEPRNNNKAMKQCTDNIEIDQINQCKNNIEIKQCSSNAEIDQCNSNKATADMNFTSNSTEVQCGPTDGQVGPPGMGDKNKHVSLFGMLRKSCFRSKQSDSVWSKAPRATDPQVAWDDPDKQHNE